MKHIKNYKRRIIKKNCLNLPQQMSEVFPDSPYNAEITLSSSAIIMFLVVHVPILKGNKSFDFFLIIY